MILLLLSIEDLLEYHRTDIDGIKVSYDPIPEGAMLRQIFDSVNINNVNLLFFRRA